MGWNEEIGEWQLHYVAYTGNNMRQRTPTPPPQAFEQFDKDLDMVYWTYGNVAPAPKKKRKKKESRRRAATRSGGLCPRIQTKNCNVQKMTKFQNSNACDRKFNLNQMTLYQDLCVY